MLRSVIRVALAVIFIALATAIVTGSVETLVFAEGGGI